MALIGMVVIGLVFYGALVVMALSIVRTGKEADQRAARTFVSCSKCRTSTDVPVWRHERPYCPSCHELLKVVTLWFLLGTRRK